MSPRADLPCMNWGDAVFDDGGGCVVQMPHDADRFLVAIAATHTEAWYGAAPYADDITSVEHAWGRILTFGEQWERHCDHEGLEIGDGPPPRWYADEPIPAWEYRDTEAPGYEPIWIVKWR